MPENTVLVRFTIDDHAVPFEGQSNRECLIESLKAGVMADYRTKGWMNLNVARIEVAVDWTGPIEWTEVYP